MRMMGFYRTLVSSQRTHAWVLLRRLKDMENLSWLCLGDYIELLVGPSKKCSTHPHPRFLMNNFWNALDDCELIDIGFSRPCFTWSNKRDVGVVQQSLDRNVCSLDWKILFPGSRVIGIKKNGIRKRFFFEACWADNEKFKKIIADSWGNICGRCGLMEEAVRRLDCKLEGLLEIEENYWRQWARQDWFKVGDCNTRFFHWKASSRMARNAILGLIKDDGNFQLISLCTMMYKIVVKSLANRFRVVLGVVISESHSAFVPGRLITDNAIIGYECIHALCTRIRKKLSIGLKLNMSKAYDRIE
ncbi:hypothetical protein Ddye_004163 [Dipteronia dyeriana]|uniref:Reverse transcriptase n=1 Tax=Dipteronia dyeriana TaxID=168575 RepID=A0AAE0CW49_9ROSI|nr:hypothetical protein Ddye_004163 [Dipteronia dyeriana]